jgi:hypothetical protein
VDENNIRVVCLISLTDLYCHSYPEPQDYPVLWVTDSTAGGQGFFVEDTFLITPTGHEVLNPRLPYAPWDIEKAMAQRSNRSAAR